MRAKSSQFIMTVKRSDLGLGDMNLTGRLSTAKTKCQFKEWNEEVKNDHLENFM